VSGVNYLAVLVAAVLNMVVGALWYSPALFGKRWMALMGWRPEDAQQRMAGAQKAYALTFVASLLTAYALARVLAYAQTFTLTGGALIGLLAWIGFVATSQGTNYLFEGRPFRLYTINTGYHLVSLVLMGALLGVWR
jgi:surface polysaccharide O-acyltransferase-like enzyme